MPLSLINSLTRLMDIFFSSLVRSQQNLSALSQSPDILAEDALSFLPASPEIPAVQPKRRTPDSFLPAGGRQPSGVRRCYRGCFGILFLQLQIFLSQISCALRGEVCRRNVKDCPAALLALPAQPVCSSRISYDHGGGEFRIRIQL